MTKNNGYHGQCLCGQIQYEVSQIEARMAHCHCAMCRKFHGAAFSTFAEAKAEHFKWLTGEDKLQSYVADNGTRRQFCSVCGSSMTFASADNDSSSIEFALATLDEDIEVFPDAHIHTESKVAWISLCDDLPQYLKDRK